MATKGIEENKELGNFKMDIDCRHKSLANWTKDIYECTSCGKRFKVTSLEVKKR